MTKTESERERWGEKEIEEGGSKKERERLKRDRKTDLQTQTDGEKGIDTKRQTHADGERGGGRKRQRQTVRETLAQENAERYSECV